MAARTISLSSTQVALVAVAGAAAPSVLRWTYNLAKFAWRHLLRGSKDLSQYGEWALVTGATDGIGRSYCDRFAEQGLNILLVSRNTEKLKAAAAEIESKYGVQCKCHTIDLVEAAAYSTEASIWTDLRDAIQTLDIGLLVNNAGACYSYSELYSELDASTVHNLPAINVSSLAKVTRLVLPGMMERNRGAIVNVSSIAAARIADGCPLVSLYAGTKAFVDNFSAGLTQECQPAGIHVQVQSPAFVNTKMFVQPNDSTVVSADTFTKQAVRHIGYETRAIPCVKHAIFTALTHALPRSVYFKSNWVKGAELRQQALQEMRAGSRAPSGSLASADSLPPDQQAALLRLDSRKGGSRVS